MAVGTAFPVAVTRNQPLVIEDPKCETAKSYLHFKNVSFKYPNGKEVLHKVSFDLEREKTYAFVGPTGGGKTTTASLIARYTMLPANYFTRRERHPFL